MIFLQLYLEFFKIGLFAVGGGMAAIPFLQRLSDSTGWFSQALVSDMIAISESTPGPIGINMATYVGFNVSGIIGGIIATLGVVTPAVVIVTIVSIYLQKFSKSKAVGYIFYGLRPAVTGLIAAAGYSVVKIALMNWKGFAQTGSYIDLFQWGKLLYCVIVFLAIKKFKKHPVVYIAASAAVGLLLGF